MVKSIGKRWRLLICQSLNLGMYGYRGRTLLAVKESQSRRLPSGHVREKVPGMPASAGMPGTGWLT